MADLFPGLRIKGTQTLFSETQLEPYRARDIDRINFNLSGRSIYVQGATVCIELPSTLTIRSPRAVQELNLVLDYVGWPVNLNNRVGTIRSAHLANTTFRHSTGLVEPAFRDVTRACLNVEFSAGATGNRLGNFYAITSPGRTDSDGEIQSSVADISIYMVRFPPEEITSEVSLFIVTHTFNSGIEDANGTVLIEPREVVEADILATGTQRPRIGGIMTIDNTDYVIEEFNRLDAARSRILVTRDL